MLIGIPWPLTQPLWLMQLKSSAEQQLHFRSTKELSKQVFIACLMWLFSTWLFSFIIWSYTEVVSDLRVTELKVLECGFSSSASHLFYWGAGLFLALYICSGAF